jgi:hypothetical protein
MITEFKIFENKDHFRLLTISGSIMKKFMENFFESELYKGPETTTNYQMEVKIIKPNMNLIMIKMEGITDLNPVITCIIFNSVLNFL